MQAIRGHPLVGSILGATASAVKWMSNPRRAVSVVTLRVTAYDNGMIRVDGVPINAPPDNDAGHGWLGAAETVLLTLSEVRMQVEVRQITARAK
jgi:hypothetical protein